MDHAEVVMLAEDRQVANWAADSAELMRWKGRLWFPRAGCRMTFMPLGNASVKVEYEYLGDSVNVLHMLINGQILDAECWLNADVLAGWEEEILASHKRDERRGV